jgi:hypothetical protein
VTDPLIAWLRDSDPAIRWQVERDLTNEPPEVWEATRARVAKEGFGAQLLARQDPDGQWAGGAFFPNNGGEPWTATTWTLNSLREWGLDPTTLQGTAERLAKNSRWEYNNQPYWTGEVDCCINAWTVANGTWLGADITGIVDWFAEHQLPDGGWNCENSTRSSFHSTLNSLKGLSTVKGTEDLRRPAEEYLLKRSLFRRLSTGEPVAPWVDHFAYPTRWEYNILNAAEYFRGKPRDPRMTDAIERLRAARQPDGTWLQAGRAPGQVWFEVDAPAGEPSKWLTLYGTRILAWWDEA